jgi:uncharacterized zinc-type alcohol dehydrogenase-like protein
MDGNADSGKRIRSVGYAAREKEGNLSPFNFERRELGPNDVLIETLYCGICHSDIHQVNSDWGDSTYPIVPGHEIIGKITAVGSGVKKFAAGDIAGVGCMVDSCKKCEACLAGEENNCEKEVTWTYNSPDRKSGGVTYGGYSSNIVVDQDFALRIPKGMDLASAAPLLCAGITTYSPLRHWKVGKGQKVGVIGLGGLGHMALKLAKSMGAHVTVFTTSDDKIKDAKALGADEVAISRDKNEMERRANSLDFIIDTVSAQHDIDGLLSLLKRNGHLVIVGLPSKPMQVGAFSLVAGRKSFSGSGIGGIRETQEMLDYCAEKGIGCNVEVIPIQEVNEAYKRVIRAEVKYRFVIDMASLRQG